jgi:glyceraldehyde 3-phosphate dehydrogenase
MKHYQKKQKKNPIKVGINGFGRIGRMVTRLIHQTENIKVNMINTNFTDISQIAYLMKYDTCHGTYPGKVYTKENKLYINDHKIHLSKRTNPEDIPWEDIDCVIDCTGKFRDYSGLSRHNVKKVILSAPSKNDDVPMIVMGVNDNIIYDNSINQNILSIASCTTNCVAPLVKLLDQEYGISEGIITTVHAATASQNVVDSREKSGKKWRIGRSILNNIIPTTTGATKSVERVYSNVKGKLSGTSIRVPVDNVSLATLTVHLDKATNKDEIFKMIQKYSEGEMQNILSYTTELLVSSDLNGNTHSCIYDANGTVQVNENFYTFLCWYDNEWGYSSRLVDVLQKMFQ